MGSLRRCHRAAAPGQVRGHNDPCCRHEIFTLQALDHGRIALRAHNGQYVGAARGGGAGIDAGRARLGEHETFFVAQGQRVGQSQVALRAAGGKFLGAANGGGGSLDAGRADRPPLVRSAVGDATAFLFPDASRRVLSHEDPGCGATLPRCALERRSSWRSWRRRAMAIVLRTSLPSARAASRLSPNSWSTPSGPRV